MQLAIEPAPSTAATQDEVVALGSAKAVPGAISRGTYPLLELATGQIEELQVIIACGKNVNPSRSVANKTLLVTANIHGDEVTGVVVVHRLMETLELDKLDGIVVAIPTLNPTGHRAQSRYPQFEKVDPNRLWPDCNPKAESPTEEVKVADDWLTEYVSRSKRPGSMERCWARLWSDFEKLKPSVHIDLHTCHSDSIPFAIVDRVLYRGDATGAKDKAEELAARTRDMVTAMGITTVMESTPWKYVADKLHRSTAGATLNGMRIPSCTLELGHSLEVSPEGRQAALTAVKNVLVWAEMLPDIERKQQSQFIRVCRGLEPHRWLDYPFAPVAGIVDFQKNPGDFFAVGELLAVIRHLDGRQLAEVRAEVPGFVILWESGIAKQEGAQLGIVGCPDRYPTVVDWNVVNGKEEIKTLGYVHKPNS